MRLGTAGAKERIDWAHRTMTFEQNAEPDGTAPCSGCGLIRRVVYSNYLQWCEECWPAAAPFSPDTQSKDWETRRRGQVRDYQWSAQR